MPPSLVKPTRYLLRSECLLRGLLALATLLTVADSGYAQSGTFNVKIGSPPAPPLPLVRSDNFWHYHKGTNAPQADWKTADDDLLNPVEWASGRGGFGYGDNDDTTVLTDMRGLYSTLYIRQSFAINTPFGPEARLRLVLDFDDACVAWLDGVEVARSTNAPGAIGTTPAHTAIATAPRNASGDQNGVPTPAVVVDLGPASSLASGIHTLSVMGLNDDIATSSDFSLIVNLSVVGADSGSTIEGAFFTLVKTNQVTLTGTNTLANSTRVTVNGVNASFNSVDGTWSHTQPLKPGMNHLFIAAHDANGAILGSISKDVVAEVQTTSFGGLITANTSWPSNTVIRVTNNVIVRDGATLTIAEGAVVLVPATGGVTASTNGAINAAGTYENPIFFLPADGTASWREVAAIGTNSTLTLRHAETVAGRLRAERGGTVLAEDSTLRDVPNLEMINGVNGASLTLRRTHVLRFGELDSSETPLTIEDTLMERINVDALDIKTTTSVPMIVRRSTLRYGATAPGTPGGPDADGVDLGPGGATVENCLIHDFDDKGVSIGTSAHRTIVQNSLIYNCGLAGISAYSSSNCVVSQSTISLCSTGLFLRNNPGPALIAGTNNIVWGNAVQIGIQGTSTIDLSYSDVQGGFPGNGNIDSDPLFVNAVAKDFRLNPGSPAIGTGFGGANMGTSFPVGGIPSAPFNLAALVDGTNEITLTWQEDADNEVAFLIERSTNSANWEFLGFVNANQTSYADSSAAMGQQYFYRVRAENSSGISRFSNIAGGKREVPTTYVSGTLAADTIWSGIVIVQGTVTVPTNITLTISPGTLVRVTNNAAIQATGGGAIHVAGTEGNKVTIEPFNAGANWQELSADGAGASLTVQHAEVSGARTAVRNAAAGLLEDSFFHDFRITGCSTLTCPIVMSSFASSMTLRRCHVREYYETLFRDGVITVEDCLFEYMNGDALDFDGAQTGTVLRRSTFRHGTRATDNIDAVDVGPGASGASRDVVIEDCLMFDFPTDKGVSIGDAPQQAVGTIVRNCLIYGCKSGIQAKDSCIATVYNCTLVSNRWGFTNYAKASGAGGGHTISYNNILWDNGVTVSMFNGGTLTADHCDLGNTNWPGDGNLNANPLFVNAAERDYRLLPNSPCLGTGRDGANMGATLPVGSIMSPSNPYFTSIKVENGEVILQFWADNEKTYTVQKSPSLPATAWAEVADVPAPPLPRRIEVRDAIPSGQAVFYRLVTPMQ
jgi:hypothetical protein